MAKPTTRIERKTEEATLDLDSLVKQFMARQEAFNEFMDVIQLLHERGILTALKAALLRYEEVLSVVAEWLNSMGAQSPTNLLELVNILSKADVRGLSTLISAASKGAGAKAAEHPPTLEELMKSLEDEDVKRGLWVVVHILSEIGQLARADLTLTK
ncbi:MAG: DUF1641 domain-containing protein [Thermoprotei archaeon]